MASSSVSQDDPLQFDFEKSSRRHIANNDKDDKDADGDQAGLEQNAAQNLLGADKDDCGEDDLLDRDHHRQLDASPKPVLRSSKEKRSGKLLPLPSHSHHSGAGKGKAQRDRRKLREKRRSTGVVHLASTESTGGSTTGDDEESSDALVMGICAETKRNTALNEHSPHPASIGGSSPASHLPARPSSDQLQLASNEDEDDEDDVHEHSPRKHHHVHHHHSHHHSHHQYHHHSGGLKPGSVLRNTVRTSDLEADDENDHDSLNQSEEGSSSINSVSAATSLPTSGGSPSRIGRTSEAVANAVTSAARLHGLSSQSPPNSSQMERVVEENRRLHSLMEEKDKRIQLLEWKIQQLMKDTRTISEEQSKLQQENTDLKKAVSRAEGHPSKGRTKK